MNECNRQCPLQTGNGSPKGERWVQWVQDRLKEGDNQMIDLRKRQIEILEEVTNLRSTLNRWMGAAISIPIILSAIYTILKLLKEI